MSGGERDICSGPLAPYLGGNNRLINTNNICAVLEITKRGRWITLTLARLHVVQDVSRSFSPDVVPFDTHSMT